MKADNHSSKNNNHLMFLSDSNCFSSTRNGINNNQNTNNNIQQYVRFHPKTAERIMAGAKMVIPAAKTTLN